MKESKIFGNSDFTIPERNSRVGFYEYGRLRARSGAPHLGDMRTIVFADAYDFRGIYFHVVKNYLFHDSEDAISAPSLHHFSLTKKTYLLLTYLSVKHLDITYHKAGIGASKSKTLPEMTQYYQKLKKA